MRKNGLHRMHVLQYELESAQRDPLAKIPRNRMASLNTHDMSPFAAWWHESDIEDRIARELLSVADARGTRAERRRARAIVLRRLGLGATSSDSEVLVRTLEEYARSPASVLLVNLEDLWLEREPQNVPGTDDQRPNWRRRLRHPLSEIRGLREVSHALRRIDAARKIAAARSK